MSETYVPGSEHDLWLEADGRIFYTTEESYVVRANVYQARYPRVELVITANAEPYRQFGVNEAVIADLLNIESSIRAEAKRQLFAAVCLKCGEPGCTIDGANR